MRPAWPAAISCYGIFAWHRQERESALGTERLSIPMVPWFMRKFTPQEAEIIRTAYDSLIGQDWFNRNAITEREMLKVVLRTFLDGAQSSEALFNACEREARKRFSRMERR